MCKRNKMRYIEIGYNISFYRKRAHKSREECAEILGISIDELNDMETDLRMTEHMTVDILLRIADELGIDAAGFSR